MNSTQLKELFKELTLKPTSAVEESVYIYIDKIKVLYSDEVMNNTYINVNEKQIWNTESITIGEEKFVGESIFISDNEIVVQLGDNQQCRTSFILNQPGYYNYRKNGFLVTGKDNTQYQVYFSAVV